MSKIYIRIELCDDREQDACRDKESSYKDVYRFHEGCNCFRCALCRAYRA